mmetsp:Transcript_37671/g.111456  ORF Transcript_37671/g.111456 Transcript_37671/m.111456 type:complete len:256 (+) Transcript_37671:711-1478(+)
MSMRPASSSIAGYNLAGYELAVKDALQLVHVWRVVVAAWAKRSKRVGAAAVAAVAVLPCGRRSRDSSSGNGAGAAAAEPPKHQRRLRASEPAGGHDWRRRPAARGQQRRQQRRKVSRAERIRRPGHRRRLCRRRCCAHAHACISRATSAAERLQQQLQRAVAAPLDAAAPSDARAAAAAAAADIATAAAIVERSHHRVRSRRACKRGGISSALEEAFPKVHYASGGYAGRRAGAVQGRSQKLRKAPTWGRRQQLR